MIRRISGNIVRAIAIAAMSMGAIAAAAEEEAVSGAAEMESLLRERGVVAGDSAVFAAEGVLAADEVRVSGRGEVIEPPFARFRFAFVDDRPGANWAHPCRYVFVSEDGESVEVLDRRWMPRLVVRATGEGVMLGKSGAAAHSRSLAEVTGNAYGYAESLAANGLSYRYGDRSSSYFVIVSGGSNPYLNGIRFWSDVAMMYSTLTRKYGVPKSNIRVFMSDGQSTGLDANLDDEWFEPVDSPWDLDGDGKPDIAGAATKANVAACFADLKSRLTGADQLFVFITGHGDAIGTPGPSNYNCFADMFTAEEDGYYYKDADEVSDKDLAAWTKGIACPAAFAIEACYSGGFIDDLVATPNRAVATSCHHYEMSWGKGGRGYWLGGDYGRTSSYNYWCEPFIAAFRGCHSAVWSGGYPWLDASYGAVNADFDSNGRISFDEARLYAQGNDEMRCRAATHPAWCSFDHTGGENEYEHPQYGENPAGFGASFYMLKPSGTQSLSLGGAQTAFAGGATYLGWVRGADGSIAGLLEVKAAKASVGSRSRLTVSYTPYGGKKRAVKLSADAMPVVGSVATVTLPGIGTVNIGGDTIEGVDVDVQAARDVMKSGSAIEKLTASAFASVMAGSWTFALGTDQGYAAFSVSLDRKGKARIVGTLPDGTKVSLAARGVIGDGVLAVPFSYAKKGAAGFVFWAKGGGYAEVTDVAGVRLANGTALSASVVAPSASRRLSDGEHVFSAAGVEQGFSVAGRKWTVPKQDKRASPDPNPTGLKLSFAEKTGAVKGSFTHPGGKAKYMVCGGVVGGAFYGSAYRKGTTPTPATAD